MSPDRAVIEEVQARGDPDESTEAGAVPQPGRAPSRTRASGIRSKKASGSRIPSGSPFYARVLPILILAMGVLTAVLILFAAGVVLGIVPFR